VEAQHDGSSGRSRELDRFLTFVDAVVAIAITLLVLPLVDVATGLSEGGSVSALLDDHLPELFGFLLSFAVIAQLWFAQHRVVSTLVVQDPVVTRLLSVWLLSIVVLPFPTSLVAQAGEQAATKVLYIGTMAASAVCLSLISWRIARTPQIRDAEVGPDPAIAVATAVTFLVALVVSLLVPSTSYYPLLLLLVSDRVVALLRTVRHRGRPGVRMGR
jgi:uncharacterized membrane protein